MTARRLLLIADDYAISPAVSSGIRALAERGRLSATGVMTTMPHWPAEAPALRVLHDRVAVGLHFTLTDQAPLGAMPTLAPKGRLPPIGKLILACLRGGLPGHEIAGEFERQLQSFERHFGAPPDFIDGHQHVHLLPGIWPIVQGAFGVRLDPRCCWLRDCFDLHVWRRGSRFKAGTIAALGWAASRAAHHSGLRINRGFSGFYDYGAGSLADYFRPMLRAAGDGHALMVHPGHVDASLRAVDSLTDARQREWDFLAGDDFPAQLEAEGMTLASPRFLIDDDGNDGHTASS